jgi:hypothetical protein
MSIQDLYIKVDEISRSKKVGQMLYHVAAMLQSMNQLSEAIQAISESVYYHRRVVNQTENGVLTNSNYKKVAYIYHLHR